MRKYQLRTISLIVLLALLAGCSQAEPTATATQTPVPPTPMPTITPLPPTAPPTAEPDVAGNTWFKLYGGRQDDVANALLLADDGGYYIVGATNLEFDAEMQGDIYLIRTDAAGEVLWEKTYADEGYWFGYSISEAKDGGLLISGVTASPDSNGMDIFVTKLDQDGNRLWTQTFGGPLDEYGTAWPVEDGGYLLGGNLVDPNDVVVDDPGAAGYGGLAGRSNVYLARTDDDGDALWSRTFGGQNNVMTAAAAPSPDGGFVILATIMYYPENDDDIYLLKVDRDGNEVWSRTWEQDLCTGRGLIPTADGSYLLTGTYSPIDDTDRSDRDFLFIKIDPDGNELWQNSFGDPDKIDYASVLVEAADGGYVAAGNRVTSFASWDENLVLVKIDENGQPLWEQVVETNSHNMFGAILRHPDGGYVVTGSTFRNDGFDIFLLKTDAEGNVTAALPSPTSPATSDALPGDGSAVRQPDKHSDTWVRSYEDEAIGTVLDGVPSVEGGYLFVGSTHHTHRNRDDEDIYLMATDATGELRWEKTLGGERFDRGNRIIAAADGGFLILGETRSLGAGDRDVYLLKIDSDGEERWSRVYGGPQEEKAFDIRQTADGGYILTGQTASFGAGGTDVYLIKTDAQGNEEWSRTFGDEEDQEGYAAVELEGGFLVLGVLLHEGWDYAAMNPDVYLIRTDASGDELWSEVRESPGVQSGHKMLPTSDGHYLITGLFSVNGGNAGIDPLLLKIDADGNTIWEQAVGEAGVMDYGTDVVEMADGGYLLTGMSTRNQGGIPLIKLDENGQVLWREYLSEERGNRAGLKILESPTGGYLVIGNVSDGGQGWYTLLIGING